MFRCLQRRRNVYRSAVQYLSEVLITPAYTGHAPSHALSEPGSQAAHKPNYHAFRFCSRGFAASEAAVETASTIHVAGEILHQMNVRRLVEHFKEESQLRLTMPIEEAVMKAREFGCAANEREAYELLRALQISAQILYHEETVYLRPEEVAKIIVQALPDTPQEAQEKVEEIEQDLHPLHEEFAKIERQAANRTMILSFLGLCALVAQLAIFVRLTYWELSWDVVEPLAFFNSQFMAILAYTYFLFFRQDFTYEQLFKTFVSNEKSKLIQQQGFNYDKYHRLVNDLDRWKRFCRSLARR